MIRRAISILALGAVLVGTARAARAAIATSEDLQRVCEQFYKLDLDAARAHDVTNVTLVRDIATIRMTKGVLIFSQAIEGVTPVAVFLGEGSFTATPKRKMDRDMLTLAGKEHLKKDLGGMVNSNLAEAFFIAYDNAWDQIKPSLSAPRAASPRELERARGILKDRLQVLENVQSVPELGLIATVLAGPQEDAALRAEMRTADHGWLAFSWAPGQTYEVRLSVREPVGAFYDTHPLIVAHRKSDLDENGRYVADPNADLHESIKVKKYRMNLEIPDLQQINIDVDVTFAPKADGLKAVAFDLVNDIQGPRWNSRAKWVDVKSVTDEAGNQLPFVHRKNVVAVLLGDKVEKDKDRTLNFKLNENTVIQLSNVSWLMLNTYPWFPQYGYLGGQYQLDWTVKTVKPLTVTGSGKQVKRWEEEKFNAVQMVFDRPVQFPSIIFGRFQPESGEYDSVAGGSKVALATYSWPKTVFSITDPEYCSQPGVRCPESFELDVPSSKPKDVVEEGKTIIKFMEDLYGPFPYEKLDVAMMAPFLGFGQAPPAFVQLTGEAFMSPAEIDAKLGGARLNFFHGFYSHEIAHQWWGHKLGWIADEDQWLSESYAEYSAGLYVLSYLGKKAWEDKLKDWRERARIGDPHASIAWCNNVSGPQAFRWRTGLIYNKGPYVVHMLRMQMGLDNYKKAMKSLFQKYGYTNVSTYELQRECEAVVGYKLDFFFDQWFRDTGIPVFDYSWTAEKQADGKYLVSVKMSQRDKEKVKQLLMPVFFYFKGQKEPLVKTRPVLKAEDLYQLKLPEKPVRVVLDEDHDLLADMIPTESAAGE